MDHHSCLTPIDLYSCGAVCVEFFQEAFCSSCGTNICQKNTSHLAYCSSFMEPSATARHLSLHGRRPSRVHCFNTHTCILLLFLWVFIVLRTFYRCNGATTTFSHSRYRVLGLQGCGWCVPGVSRRRRQPWLWQSFSWHAGCRWWHRDGVLKENLQNTTALFVDETWDALDSPRRAIRRAWWFPQVKFVKSCKICCMMYDNYTSSCSGMNKMAVSVIERKRYI